MKDVDRFIKLFRGNDRCHGVCSSDGQKHYLVHSAPTEQTFKEHLNGTSGVGIGPIQDNDMCYWGAIDFDTHGDDVPDAELLAIEADIRKNGFPLTVCRSKGGGAHLFLFCSKETDASRIKKTLTVWARVLFPMDKHRKPWPVDIFPIQEKLHRNEDGSLQYPGQLNLPYFDAKNTEGKRYCVEGLKRVSLSEFLQAAESRTVELESVEHAGGDYVDAPPCLKTLVQTGVQSYRNPALYNYCIYLRKAFPEEWREKAREVNDLYFSTPLPIEEVRRVLDNVSKRDYKYKCKEEPCRSVCNSSACVLTKFGISSDEKDDMDILQMPVFGTMKKILTVPPKWELVVNEKKLWVSTDTLFHWGHLQLEIANVATVVAPPLKTESWLKILSPMMKEATVEQAPSEASAAGIVRARFEDFLKKADLTSEGHDKFEHSRLESGQPIVFNIDNKKMVVFKATDLIKYLKDNKAHELKEGELWLELQKMGTEAVEIEINRKQVKVWAIKHNPDWNIVYVNPVMEPEY